MLDKFTQRLMDSLHKSVKDKVIPLKEVLKRNVNARVDMGSTILKFGTMVLMLFGILKMKDNGQQPNKNDIPGTIIINNYLGDGREKEETK
jgi:hypothetical protein